MRDVPWQLMQAIKAALIFLSFEEMPHEDQPPRSIWTDSGLLTAHMDNVRRRYREKGEGRDMDGAQQNDAARMLIAGR